MVCFTTLAWLTACSHQASPPIESQLPEAQQYAAKARGDYTPPGPPEDPWGPYITEASHRFDVPDRWIREVMRVESGGDLYRGNQLVTSWAGAMGLMQVMPHTYEGLKQRYNLGDDPFDPHDNIMAGAAYLREMYDMYGSPGFLAAYNAGPRRLDDYLANIRPLPAETRHYVAMIGPYVMDSYPQQRSAADQYAMNTLPTEIPAGLRYGGATAFADETPAEPAAAPERSYAEREPPRAYGHAEYARTEYGRAGYARTEYARAEARERGRPRVEVAEFEERHNGRWVRVSMPLPSSVFANAAFSAHGWHVEPSSLSEPFGHGRGGRVIAVGAYATEPMPRSATRAPVTRASAHTCQHGSKSCPTHG